MSKEIVAIATADWHIHKFRQFNRPEKSRLDWCIWMVRNLLNKSAELKVPLLFAGDLIHNPKEVENETITRVIDTIGYNIRQPFIAISGNHDMSEKNALGHKSPSYLAAFKHLANFHRVDNAFWSNDKLAVWGIPYMNDSQDVNIQLKKLSKDPGSDRLKILLLHTDLLGAKTPEGFSVNESKIKTKYFKNWDLVLAGHIHMGQKLGKNVYMLGTPIAQDAGHVGIPCGYWEIYSDASVEFVELKNFPKFIKGEQDPTDELNYFLPPEEITEENEREVGKFTLNQSRDSLAKKYCKVKGIKDKKKRQALIKILNES
jgi:DNA repair exonuclease SbcCD nuclease subunit